MGQDAADRYIPAQPDNRVPVDAKMAELENQHLEEGKEISVFPNELHVVHLDVHLPKIEANFQAMEEGQIELVEATQMSVNIFQHAVQHLEQIQQDTSIQEKVGDFNQRLQIVSEMIVNGNKAIEKQERDAALEAQAQAEAGGEGGQLAPEANPQNNEKFIEHRLKLQMMEEKHKAEMFIRLQKAEQERQIADAKGATTVRELLH